MGVIEMLGRSSGGRSPASLAQVSFAAGVCGSLGNRYHRTCAGNRAWLYYNQPRQFSRISGVDLRGIVRAMPVCEQFRGAFTRAG